VRCLHRLVPILELKEVLVATAQQLFKALLAPIFRATSAPPATALGSNEFNLWLDPTPGASFCTSVRRTRTAPW
jgi:hypothetical protein